MPAIDGREDGPGLFVAARGRPIVRPTEPGRGAGGAVDAGQLPYPEVHLDRQRGPTGARPDVPERAGQVGQQPDPARVRPCDGGEFGQRRGVGSVSCQLLHYRVRTAGSQQELGVGLSEPFGWLVVEQAEHGVCDGGAGRVEAQRVDGRHGSGQVDALGRYGRQVGVLDRGCGGADPFLDVQPGLGDHRLRTERFTEHRLGERAHHRRVALVPQRRRGRDRGDVAQWSSTVPGVDRRVVVTPVALERHAQPSQQHRHVGALRTVVGVELVQDQVGQAGGRLPPERLVGGAQQQLVEHLVVGEQDVRRIVTDDLPIGDQPIGVDRSTGRAAFTGVDGRGDPSKLRILGQQPGQSAGLVVRERVHRVEDQRLDARHPVAAGPAHVVEDRHQERFGLARSGTGGDQGRQRPTRLALHTGR